MSVESFWAGEKGEGEEFRERGGSGRAGTGARAEGEKKMRKKWAMEETQMSVQV